MAGEGSSAQVLLEGWPAAFWGGYASGENSRCEGGGTPGLSCLRVRIQAPQSFLPLPFSLLQFA